MPDVGTANLLTAVGGTSLALYLIILGVKYVLSRRYAAARPEEAAPDGGEVTVLQPIRSGDPLLESALRHNLDQAPPWAHLVWLIDADDPEARRVTDRLLGAAPGRAAIVTCPPVCGDVNPKTAKLEQALGGVATEYVAVLDDDTQLAADHLARAVAGLRRCTLYTGLPCYLPGANFWAALVAHFVNNNSILTYLALPPLVGPLTINGMFYVMRTQALRDLGGYAPILGQLCDDYALARLLKAHGGTICQAAAPQCLNTTVPGPAAYVRLMHRWFVFANVLVRDQTAGVTALLFVFLGLPPLLLWLGLLSVAGGAAGCLLLAAALGLRHLALRSLHRAVFGGLPHFSWALSLLSELLQPLHWLHAGVQPTLRWRTRHIRVGRDGRFSYLTGDGP